MIRNAGEAAIRPADKGNKGARRGRVKLRRFTKSRPATASLLPVTDLNLVFENVKIVRGMEGYGWFANIISTTRTSLTSNTRSISGSDDKTGEEIPLQFVEMNRPIRHLKKGGEHFACTDFRKPGQEGRVLRHRDFLLDEKTGKLKVCNIKMHKVPVQEDGIWMQVPRYTFESMDFEETN